jgi:glycosyltransferase involved in cell wall biosynthesis
MKIVYLHQYFKTPDMAGGTRSYEMARRFVARGHQVHMVTSRSAPLGLRGWSVEEIDGISVHWLNLQYDNKLSFRRRIGVFAAFALRSAPRARRLKGDVVFATSTPLTIVIPAIAATLFRGTEMVFEVRDLWPEIPIALGALRNKHLQNLARWLERLAYRYSFAVVALSNDMADGVRAVGVTGRVEVISNSCDNEAFGVGDDVGEQFRNDRDWLGDKPLVVYTGTLGMVNGVTYMVDLAAAYGSVEPDTRFLVVGDGAERQRVEDRALELGILGRNFFMEPAAAKKQMPAVLNAADISCSWVIPVLELEANSANKFFDTLAAGRPIAINHGGWQADTIQAHRLGVVLNAHDPAGSATCLHAFLTDPDAVAHARVVTRQLAENTYDRDRLATRLLDVLESAARARFMPSTPRQCGIERNTANVS